MAFYAYMLRCSDGLYYVGSTDDLDQRVAQHLSGHDPLCYTFKRRPVALVWSESLSTRIEAKEAERRLKGWGKRKKEALVATGTQCSFSPAIGRAECSLTALRQAQG